MKSREFKHGNQTVTICIEGADGSDHYECQHNLLNALREAHDFLNELIEVTYEDLE